MFNNRHKTLYADELNLILKTKLQLKNHYFSIELQPLLPLPEKESQFAQQLFFHISSAIYGKQLTTGTVLFICDLVTDSYTSLIYDTLFHPLSDTLFDFLRGVYAEIHTADCGFRKSSFEFLKRLASALTTAESVHKIARQKKRRL